MLPLFIPHLLSNFKSLLFQESLDKKVQRAKRFGIPKEKIEIDEKLASLYDRYGFLLYN